jgi:hypothetical protein
MKILLALAAFALAAVLIVSATMGAGTLVPGGDDKKKTPGAGAGVAANGKARIVPTSFAPPVLKGTGFRSGENVSVTVLGGGAVTKRVTADSSGSFTLRLSTRMDRCNGMTVTAVGDKGSRTSFQFAELLCAVEGAGP